MAFAGPRTDGPRALAAGHGAPSSATAPRVAGASTGVSADQQGVAGGELPAQRLASIVSVAVGEYGKGVDAHGKLISAEERDEATGFLVDAHDVADRLLGLGGSQRPHWSTRCSRRCARNDRWATSRRFIRGSRRRWGTRGARGAEWRPRRGGGRRDIRQTCASCHGALGQGNRAGSQRTVDGPTRDRVGGGDGSMTPALMYRLVSVGVRGTAMPCWASARLPQIGGTSSRT